MDSLNKILEKRETKYTDCSHCHIPLPHCHCMCPYCEKQDDYECILFDAVKGD